MASVWTVAPESVRIELTYVTATGDALPLWVRIKKFLTVGEERTVQTAGWRGVHGIGQRAGDGGPVIDIDWRATSFARVEAYMIDWSLTDDKDQKIPLTRTGLESLHPDVFELIERAIAQHVEALEEEKKGRAGARAPVTTSA